MDLGTPPHSNRQLAGLKGLKSQKDSGSTWTTPRGDVKLNRKSNLAEGGMLEKKKSVHWQRLKTSLTGFKESVRSKSRNLIGVGGKSGRQGGKNETAYEDPKNGTLH